LHGLIPGQAIRHKHALDVINDLGLAHTEMAGVKPTQSRIGSQHGDQLTRAADLKIQESVRTGRFADSLCRYDRAARHESGAGAEQKNTSKASHIRKSSPFGDVSGRTQQRSPTIKATKKQPKYSTNNGQKCRMTAFDEARMYRRRDRCRKQPVSAYPTPSGPAQNR
jgi:hypothetical protein